MGGGATRAHNMAVGLSRIGCEVTVIAAVPHYPTGVVPKKYHWKPITQEYDNNIRVVRTLVPPLQSRGLFRRLLLFVSFVLSSLFAIPLVGKVDVVWSANPNITATLSGFVYKKIKRCPLVQNIDDLWPEALYDLGTRRNSILGRVGEMMARMAYRLADAITPISPGYSPVIEKKYKKNPDSIYVVPSGVDSKIHEEYDTSEKDGTTKTVLYIGAFSQAYDFRQVILAANELKTNKEIRFVLQGGGELDETLRMSRIEYGLHNLEIVSEIVSRTEVARILREADILLLPLAGYDFIERGISSKLYEYQAAGKPIICCSSGESAKYIERTNSGITVEPGNYQEIVYSILKLTEDSQLSSELGQNGQRYVRENLSLETIAKSMMSIFATVGK